MTPNADPGLDSHSARNRLVKRPKRVQFSAPSSQNPTSTQVHLAPPHNRMQLSSICVCYQDIANRRVCLGYLKKVNTARFSVFSLPPQDHRKVTPTRNLVALSGLLPSEVPSSPDYVRRSQRQKALPKLLRLASGQTLAEGFLDIQGTPWLEDCLNKETVLFSCDVASGSQNWLSDPFVRCAFGPPKPPTATRSNSSTSRSTAHSSLPYPKVSGLFDLGQLLIELAFNEKFEHLFEDEDKEGGRVTRFTPLLAAQRLLDDVYVKLGPRYGDAVRRCIAGLDIREANIEDPNFRRQFYQDVVIPLRDTHRFFTGSQGGHSPHTAEAIK